MRALKLLLGLGVLTGACSPSDSRVAANKDSTPAVSDSVDHTWTVDPHGIGVVRVGMTLSELSAVVGEPVRPAYQFNETCDHAQPKRSPRASTS